MTDEIDKRIEAEETVETNNGTNNFIADIKQFIEGLKEVKKN